MSVLGDEMIPIFLSVGLKAWVNVSHVRITAEQRPDQQRTTQVSIKRALVDRLWLEAVIWLLGLIW